VPDLLIDQSRRCVYVDCQEIQLSPQEYRLLHRMGCSLGQVVSKAELLTAIWMTGNTTAEQDAVYTPAAVDLVIFRLRKKLADHPDHPVYVETRRGFGYILHHARMVSTAAAHSAAEARTTQGNGQAGAADRAPRVNILLAPWSALTRREWELFRLLGEEQSIHLTNKALAQQLRMAEGTLKKHLQNLYRKLGVENRSGATLLAMRARANL
jgi:DNA-binding CsgD family transcriptional regulator